MRAARLPPLPSGHPSPLAAPPDSHPSPPADCCSSPDANRCELCLQRRPPPTPPLRPLVARRQLVVKPGLQWSQHRKRASAAQETQARKAQARNGLSTMSAECCVRGVSVATISTAEEMGKSAKFYFGGIYRKYGK